MRCCKMADKKPQKIQLVPYLISASVEELLDGGEIAFAGESEKDRMASMTKFLHVRGILQKGSQVALTGDEQQTLLSIMKSCVVQKTTE